MEKEVKDRILEIFSRFVTDRGELDAVSSGAPILAAVSIDSLTLLSLVTELEKDFRIRFDYETIETAFEDIHALAGFLIARSDNIHERHPRDRGPSQVRTRPDRPGER